MSAAQRVVIKVGSSTLSASGGGLDRGFVDALVDQIAEVKSAGHAVVLVSSGAIAAGARADIVLLHICV